MRKLKINLSRALQEVKKRNAKRIIVQLPEGLKTRALEIIKELEKNAEVICIVDPCFGACDLAEHERKLFNADLIIHLGHNKLVKDSGKTVFIPLSYELAGKKLMKLKKQFLQKVRKVKVKKIGLVATVQYLNYLKEFKAVAKEEGIKVFLGKNKAGMEGQVLGCDVSIIKKIEKKIEGIAFIGDGLFHPLAISFAIEKPLIAINPLNESVEEFDLKERDKMLRKRILMIEKAKNAKSFGILLSTKEGQLKLNKALRIKKLLKKKGKKAFIFASDFIMPEYLLGVNVECFISTACPRIALEDYVNWKLPVINEEELKIMLGMKKVEEYCFEELF